MFFPVSIPEHMRRQYQFLRLGLWIAVLGISTQLILSMVFPDFNYTFSFRNPQSSRNTLLDPRLENGAARLNGKLSPDEKLFLNAGILGDFSTATMKTRLENKSDLTPTLAMSLRRSYRAFLFPTGPVADVFPREDIYRVDDTYYALRNGQLFPFVSEAAFLSRFPRNWAIPATPTLFRQYPVSESLLGFRVGSLLSFADGVYIVVSDTDIRPVGSAEIFLALGYRFEDVRPVSEEDLGIYRRGRIVQLGFTHPSGTLFTDRESGALFLVDGSIKRQVTDEAYAAFLKTQQTPIEASENAAFTTTGCTLVSGLFPRTLSCTASLETLAALPGSDFEITLSHPETDIDMNTLALTLETRKNSANMLRLLSQIKQRLLNRFGLGV